jgi:hypothetical protein
VPAHVLVVLGGCWGRRRDFIGAGQSAAKPVLSRASSAKRGAIVTGFPLALRRCFWGLGNVAWNGERALCAFVLEGCAPLCNPRKA